MLQITPLFWSPPRTPNALNYLMMNSNAVKKKAVMTTSNLASAQGEAVGSSS